LILLTVSCNCSDSVNSNKDPVCETELHFTEKYQIVSQSFEIQFTPPLVFQPKQFPTVRIIDFISLEYSSIFMNKNKNTLNAKHF